MRPISFISSPLGNTSPAAQGLRASRALAAEQVSIVGELTSNIVDPNNKGKRRMRWILIWLLLATPVWAEGKRADEFDYYVLSLSWSPSWCARTGDARAADKCDPGRRFG